MIVVRPKCTREGVDIDVTIQTVDRRVELARHMYLVAAGTDREVRGVSRSMNGDVLQRAIEVALGGDDPSDVVKSAEVKALERVSAAGLALSTVTGVPGSEVALCVELDRGLRNLYGRMKRQRLSLFKIMDESVSGYGRSRPACVRR